MGDEVYIAGHTHRLDRVGAVKDLTRWFVWGVWIGMALAVVWGLWPFSGVMFAIWVFVRLAIWSGAFPK